MTDDIKGAICFPKKFTRGIMNDLVSNVQYTVRKSDVNL